MLDNLLSEVVRKYPKRTALVYDCREVTYEDLYNDVCSFAYGLISLGLGRSDCIALLLPNCIEFVTSFYAASRLNSIVLPINPLLKKEEIKYCLLDCDAKSIVTTVQYVGMCRDIIDELHVKIDIVLVDGEGPQAHSFYNLIGTSQTNSRAFEHFTGDVLYQYSSGSTGTSKRIIRTQENLFFEARNFVSAVNVTPDDVLLCVIPLSHAHGLGNCLLAALSSGATLVILEQCIRDDRIVDVPLVSRVSRILDLLQAEKVTIFPGVPYIFNTLAETSSDIEVDLSSLRLCFSAGNFLPKQTFDAFLKRFNIPVRQLYGCTEAGSVSINLDANIALTWNSVGLPLGSTQITIVDEQMNELPCENVGEVVIKTPSLTSGYANIMEINAEAFRDGWFFTGDLGKKDLAGRLYITDRKKFFIDTGGYKVNPLEIEEVLAAHPRVSEAVVVGIENSYYGNIVKAVVVLRDKCTEHEIISYCRSRLADFKVPRIVEFTDEIPKSPLGKILRKDLIQSHLRNQQLSITAGEVRQSLGLIVSERQRLRCLETYLQEYIVQLLQLDSPSINIFKPLSEYGLTSALAIEFQCWLEDIAGVTLSAALVWNHPNIAEIAAYVLNIVSVHRMSNVGNHPTDTNMRKDLAVDWEVVEQIPEGDIEPLLMYELGLALNDDSSDVELAKMEQLSEEKVREIFFQEIWGELDDS